MHSTKLKIAVKGRSKDFNTLFQECMAQKLSIMQAEQLKVAVGLKDRTAPRLGPNATRGLVLGPRALRDRTYGDEEDNADTVLDDGAAAADDLREPGYTEMEDDGTALPAVNNDFITMPISLGMPSEEHPQSSYGLGLVGPFSYSFHRGYRFLNYFHRDRERRARVADKKPRPHFRVAPAVVHVPDANAMMLNTADKVPLALWHPAMLQYPQYMTDFRNTGGKFSARSAQGGALGLYECSFHTSVTS
jgi:hypothetical protein